MPFTMSQASLPVFEIGLNALSGVLDKAAAHATAKKVDPSVLLGWRLAPDMFALVKQVQVACDQAKNGTARLAGVEPPKMEDNEASIDQLKERIAKTIAFLETITPEQVNSRHGATIELPLPGRTMTFTAPDFLLNFSQQNFMFHVTMAYALLRMTGVPLGKMDFLAGGQSVAA